MQKQMAMKSKFIFIIYSTPPALPGFRERLKERNGPGYQVITLFVTVEYPGTCPLETVPKRG